MKNQDTRISLFYCSNSLSEEEITSINDRLEDVKLSLVSLPCSGKVNLLYLLKAIETGSVGVILATCKFGECKYLQGNYRAQKRVESVDELLSETGFKRGRVKFINLGEESKVDTMLKTIYDLAKALRVELNEVQE